MARLGRAQEGSAPGIFATTRWSVVLTAGHTETPETRGALETLCRDYWFPLYAWLRRGGYSPHDAQDLTQSFFSHLLEKNALRNVDRGKGKFRSFLLASLKNFLANERDKAQAQKRGGQMTFISIDEEFGESRFRQEPWHDVTPDKAFEQSWALTLLDAVLGRLRQEYTADGKAPVFEVLQIYLSGDTGVAPYAATSERLGLSQSGMKMAVLRLRRRFGELLREEIAHTVARPHEVDEEIRQLFAAVSK